MWISIVKIMFEKMVLLIEKLTLSPPWNEAASLLIYAEYHQRDLHSQYKEIQKIVSILEIDKFGWHVVVGV